MIEHKKNGYLANYLDKEDFLNGINWYLDLSESEITKVNNYSREFILKKFSEKEMMPVPINRFNVIAGTRNSENKRVQTGKVRLSICFCAIFLYPI